MQKGQRIDQAVKNGRLKQTQADQLKAQLAEKLDLSKPFPLPKKP
jgi:ribosomal protein S20